ncbi:MAG: lipoprotein signal peptidase [Gammaproteobacteria bacterium]|nr:lipoprotein signal peptidase [Gammaproteobacteria bacterium]
MAHWLWLSLVVLALDQATKWVVDRSMQVYETIELLPFFQLTYLRNQGAAFSFLSDAGGWQRWFFVALSVAFSVGISYWLVRLKPDRRWEAAAWSLVLGGAVGNLIDRVLLGYVIDFLDVFYGQWHWPAFNVADSAITVGIGMLLIDSFRPPPTR